MDDCLSRSKGSLGSSTKYPAEANIDTSPRTLRSIH
jgi:hypothetical protein